MNYYLNKNISLPFEAVKEKLTENLKEQGFGIITEIDIKSTLKEKINVEFKRYHILGACNPHFAHNALMMEEKLGVFLPCNVIIVEQDDGTVDVSTMDIQRVIQMTENDELELFAKQVSERIEAAIEDL